MWAGARRSGPICDPCVDNCGFTARQPGWNNNGTGFSSSERENMDALAVLGALAVLIGIIGVIVLIRGKKKRRQ